MNKPDNIIICVGRQLGSGGHIIAKQLAETFDCKLYDREVLELAAQQSGFSTKVFEQNDEKKGFFESMFHMHVPFVLMARFMTTAFRKKTCLGCRVTLYARQQTKSRACL